jgi:antitoxin Phd
MWQLQEAKNKFSRVVDEALRSGPQVISRHGVEVVVLVSYAEFRDLLSAQKNAQQSLSRFFRESPLADVQLELGRDQSSVRADIAL